MLIAGATLASACGSGPLGVDSEITVEVSGAGDGDGLVQGSAPADIYCTITHGEVTGGKCGVIFHDAGGGGSFTLVATPAPGSRFDGFAGCNTTSGTDCELSFPHQVEDHVFLVKASFGLVPPPATNVVTFRNESMVSAYRVGPGEAPAVNNLVGPGHSRDVAIASTVESQAIFRAYVAPPEIAASITCMVTAEAWQGGTTPEISFHNDEGNYLTCSSGLVAL